MEEQEIWKVYTKSAGRGRNKTIEVSDDGNVKIDGALIDLNKYHGRYKQVLGFYVHRMVAELFIYNSDPEKNWYVDHINTERYDNRAENLKWVTPTENYNNPLTLEKRHMMEKSEETRRKKSEANKKYFSDPYNRILHSLIIKQRFIEHPELKPHGLKKGSKQMTDGQIKLYVEPEYWGEFIDIGFWFTSKIKK